MEPLLTSILSCRFTILHEDDFLIIIDKPSGLLSIPAPNKKASLTELMNQELKKVGIALHVHPCHRLDAETSGVIVFAKGKRAQKNMMECFHTRQVRKVYLAIVQGILKKDEGTLTQSIQGKEALTRFRVLERGALFTVVEVVPETGRTNQIRLHFKGFGHPLVGETRYAFRKDFPLRVSRLMLHASKITFLHPYTRIAVEVEAPLPPDMLRFLAAAQATE